MAQKVEVVLTCDLHAGDTPAVDTVTFTYNGQTYEFELCQAHLDEFNATLQAYAAVARRTAGRRPIGGGARSARRDGDPGELAAIRAWARENGMAVSDRGRISAQIRQAFEAAHA